jgi:hypothetical protein
MIAAGMLGLALAVPAHAGEKPDPFAQVESLLAPGVLFQGVVREEDISLVFAHLRAALTAAYAGREASPPEELNRRAEAIAGELKARGTLAGLLLLNAFEAAARQALRETLADTAPTTR